MIKITKFIKIQILKIYLRNSGKFQSAKLQKLQSSVSIRQQIRFNTALLAEITGVSEGEIRVKLKLMRVKVRVKIDKNRVFVRLYRGKPRLCAVEYLVRLIRVE